MLTREQLQRVREQLPVFSEEATASPDLDAFCQCYGLDFAARLPHVSYRAGTITSGGYTVAVHRWCQQGARANLLLVHGYFDHSGLYNKLIDWALAQHCNVLIFDLPGHGLSSGEPAVIEDFGDYSRAIHDVLDAVTLPPLPLWVMAQSTGCAAVIDFARNYPWPFAATVLLAPLVRPANWLGVRVAHSLLQPFLGGVKRTFAVNSSDREFLEFIKRDPLQSRRTSLRWIAALRRWLRGLARADLGVGPALVVQGDADATVDWRYNVGFVSTLFPHSHIEFLPGAGHQLANEAEHFRRGYLACVVTWLGRCDIALNDAPQERSAKDQA